MDEATLLRVLTELIQGDLPSLDEQDVDLVAGDIAVWVRDHDGHDVIEKAVAVTKTAMQMVPPGEWRNDGAQTTTDLPGDEPYICVPLKPYRVLVAAIEAANGRL